MKELEILIERVFKRLKQSESFLGKVISVDKENEVCEVEKAEGLSFYNVRLNSIIDILETKVTAYPKVGSYVICQLLNDNKHVAYISKFSEVDEIKVICEKITINDGANGGLTITPELKKELVKNNAILSAIMNVIEGISIMELGNGNPSALQIALQSAIAGKTVGSFENIENTKVRH